MASVFKPPVRRGTGFCTTTRTASAVKRLATPTRKGNPDTQGTQTPHKFVAKSGIRIPRHPQIRREVRDSGKVLKTRKDGQRIENRDTRKFVVNPVKPGKLRVGKSESPGKMSPRSPREALSSPGSLDSHGRPDSVFPGLPRRFYGCLDSRRTTVGSGELIFRVPSRKYGGDGLGLSGSWATLCPYALFLDPGRTEDARPLRRLDMAPACVNNEGSRDE